VILWISKIFEIDELCCILTYNGNNNTDIVTFPIIRAQCSDNEISTEFIIFPTTV
jgi:hypothetical protein